MNIKQIFINWEKLRLLYNLVLLIIFTAITISAVFYNTGETNITALPIFLIKSLFLAFVANILFFAGPIFDSYLTWLEINYKYKTHLIFVSGLVLSIIFELIYLGIELLQI